MQSTTNDPGQRLYDDEGDLLLQADKRSDRVILLPSGDPRTASQDRDRVRIEVHDNGTGIDPEHQEKLFHLFFSTKGRHGTGIGLAATRRLIQDHHGTIDFDTTPGEGTAFIIHLPLNQPRG